jgi:hypothetical protein
MQLRQVRHERLGDELIERLHDSLGLPPRQTERCVYGVNDCCPRDLSKQILDKIFLLTLIFAGHRGDCRQAAP